LPTEIRSVGKEPRDTRDSRHEVDAAVELEETAKLFFDLDGPARKVTSPPMPDVLTPLPISSTSSPVLPSRTAGPD